MAAARMVVEDWLSDKDIVVWLHDKLYHKTFLLLGFRT